MGPFDRGSCSTHPSRGLPGWAGLAILAWEGIWANSSWPLSLPYCVVGGCPLPACLPWGGGPESLSLPECLSPQVCACPAVRWLCHPQLPRTQEPGLGTSLSVWPSVHVGGTGWGAPQGEHRQPGGWGDCIVGRRWRGEKDPKGTPGLLILFPNLQLGQQWPLGRFLSVTQQPQCPLSLRGTLQVLSSLKGCVSHLLSPCSRSYGGVEGPGGNLNPHSLETPGNCYLSGKCRALGRWLLRGLRSGAG